MKLVPRHEFESLVYQYQGDYRVREFNCWRHFVSLLYVQITEKDSLRDIEAGINAQSHKLYHLGLKEVKRSTMSDANNNRPYEIYEQMFGKTLNRVYGKTHDAKLAQELPHDTFQADSIILVDKEYISFKWLSGLASRRCYFVARAKDNMKYASIGQHNKPQPEKGLLADKIIRLTGYYTSPKYPDDLRLVVYKDQDTGKVYEFLTNNFTLSPFTITKLYKERWQAELFYKWIKQNLSVSYALLSLALLY